MLALGIFGLDSVRKPVWGNISTTFHDSLPYAASGNYTWGIWDYLTNPYIYYLQEKDAISALITNSSVLNRKDYTIAGRFSVVSVPIYYALGLNSPSSQTETENPETANKINKVNQDQFRIMLGSHLGPKLLNLGIGAFAQIYQEREETVTREGNKDIKYYVSAEDDPPARIPSKFGLELGQKLEGKTSPSWTISLEYRIWEGTNEGFLGEDAGASRGTFNDAPFLFFPDTVFTQGSEVEPHTGNTRKEMAAHFLGWWPLPIGAASNIGLDVSFYLPSGSGRSNDSIASDGMVMFNGELTPVSAINGGNLTDEILEEFYPTITLTGYGVDTTLFYDQDFVIPNSSVVFRLSPWLRYVNRLEELKEEEVSGKRDEIRVTLKQASFGMSFKLNAPLTESENLIMHLGWRPSLLLFDETKAFQDTQAARREHKVTNPLFQADLTRFSFGFTYRVSNALNVHILANTAQDGIDISLIDIAVDYQFGVEETPPKPSQDKPL